MDKIKYYLLQWTWGLPMNIIGLIVFLYAHLAGWRIYSWRKAVCIVVPSSKFSAISLGMFIAHGTMNSQSLPHEYGHSIQNIQWGWSFLIVIGLPSFFRCLYHTFYYKFLYTNTRKSLPDYYDIWFEKQANEYGTMAKNNTWTWL